ncbi:MAG: tRNA uridine-5-carboxymethylaminomethyl(34) synthesis GTPase MnmE [Candidatus Omnitrophica bacterium]|nr:tRNA uridine-5-carboxymethylaminomethyl(34) synthesis GTPase MnmE [Candidatus Omnitrophota bacterium]
MKPAVLNDDTIAALITPPGEGGVAVLRISGPDAFKIAAAVFKSKNEKTVDSFETHTIHLGEIYSPRSASPGEHGGGVNSECSPPLAGGLRRGDVLDQALLSIFRAPQSYTGEDVIELGLHGGMVLASKVLAVILAEGARFAEPGEFTRRAFLNGKIDLTQAEAVLDLIKAKSGLSIQTAVRQLGGELSARFKKLKDRLMKLYAHMEAFLDFPDEDLEVYSDGEMAQGLRAVRDEIQQLIQSFERGSLLREGALLVIAGKPNVGKSSLFNALLERDRALVSEFAGTTRDTLEEWLEIQGLAVRLADTAGLMLNAPHPLDAMGVERAKQSLRAADAYLFILDGTCSPSEEDFSAWKSLEPGRPVIGILNKSDLGIRLSAQALQGFSSEIDWLEISSKNRSGFERVEEKIFKTLVGKNTESAGEQITRVRHKRALESALEALTRSEKAFKSRASLELVTLDLKIAIDALRELIGEVYSEDLLDVIFSEFCIGK